MALARPTRCRPIYDRDLAYFEEGGPLLLQQLHARAPSGWAQKFAAINREVMMKRVIEAAKTVIRRTSRATSRR